MVIVRCNVEHDNAYRRPIAPTPRQLALVQYLLHRVVVTDHIRLIYDQWCPRRDILRRVNPMATLSHLGDLDHT